MSSRQEEKAQRKREREAAEEAARKAAARGKRLRLVGIGVLVALALAGGVFALAIGGGDGGSGGQTEGAAAIPARSITDLDEAVSAAGCEVKSVKSEGQGHTPEPVTYKSNPPTSGSHDPVPAQDGIYEAGNPPDVEASVHSLEHGRINVQYRKGSDPQLIAQLETLAGEKYKGQAGYHVLLFENQTEMKPALAATAWTQSLTCDTVTDSTWDALRAFRAEYVDKAPEFVP